MYVYVHTQMCMSEKYINKVTCDASLESNGTVRAMGRQGSVS